MFANRPGVAQVMVGLNQTAIERLALGAAHLPDLQVSQLLQATFQERTFQLRIGHWRTTQHHVIDRVKPLGGQLNEMGSMQLQHQAATNHVPQMAIGLDPLPGKAELDRELIATRRWVLSDQLFNKLNVGGLNSPSAVAEQLWHECQSSEKIRERKSYLSPMSFFLTPARPAAHVKPLWPRGATTEPPGRWPGCHSRVATAVGRPLFCRRLPRW